MAKQTAKKTTAKTALKKTAANKTTAKVKTAPVAEKTSCGCNHGCACGGKCKCHKGGIFKKLIIFLVVFSMGFAAAKLCCCDKGRKMPPRPEFENGCLVVKCPQMAKKAQFMDLNKDGCVSVEEFKASKKQFRKMKRQPNAQPVVAE